MDIGEFGTMGIPRTIKRGLRCPHVCSACVRNANARLCKSECAYANKVLVGMCAYYQAYMCLLKSLKNCKLDPLRACMRACVRACMCVCVCACVH